MKHFDSLAPGEVTSALICFTDITRFLDIAKDKDLQEGYEFMREFSEIADEVIAPSSGQIIKYIGDAMLIAFPAEEADQGVRVLLDLNDRLTAWFASQDLTNRLTVGVDIGEVVVGPMKPIDRPDVFGSVVATAATIDHGHHGRFVISPRVFRSLDPETRKRFHKHTPPQVYLAES